MVHTATFATLDCLPALNFIKYIYLLFLILLLILQLPISQLHYCPAMALSNCLCFCSSGSVDYSPIKKKYIVDLVFFSRTWLDSKNKQKKPIKKEFENHTKLAANKAHAQVRTREKDGTVAEARNTSISLAKARSMVTSPSANRNNKEREAWGTKEQKHYCRDTRWRLGWNISVGYGVDWPIPSQIIVSYIIPDRRQRRE